MKAWPKTGPPLAFKATGAGDGYSSFAVAGGRLFTLGARGDREYVTYYNEDGTVYQAHQVQFRLERHGPVEPRRRLGRFPWP